MLTIYWLVCVCVWDTVFSWRVSVTVMPYQIRVVWDVRQGKGDSQVAGRRRRKIMWKRGKTGY